MLIHYRSKHPLISSEEHNSRMSRMVIHSSIPVGERKASESSDDEEVLFSCKVCEASFADELELQAHAR